MDICSKTAGVLATLFLMLVVRHASAALVVDTGAPINWPDPDGDPILSAGQGLAAQFTVPGSYRLTSILGFLSSTGDAGTFSISIYTDGSDVPGILLSTVQAIAPAIELQPGGIATPDWYGLDGGLSIDLDAGSYWVSFQVLSGDTLEAFMANPAPAPLALEGTHGAGGFSPAFLGLGIRIEGTAVPLPAPVLLVVLPLLALVRRAQLLCAR